MCGRYNIGDAEQIMELREILKEVNRRYIDSVSGAENLSAKDVYPTDLAPVLQNEAPSSALLMRWGFENPMGKGVLINARQETAANKKTFRQSLAQRRCVIPAGGFYEWKHEGGRARPEKYVFTNPDSGLLYFAGFYTPVENDPVEGIKYRFIILTTQAQGEIASIHDRMPVLLRKEDIGEYILGFTYQSLFLKTPPRILMKAVGSEQLRMV